MMLVLTAALAAATPPKPMNPGMWITPADYPAAAIAAGQEGVVAFRIDVSADGRPVGCTITKSSSHAVLDASTCRLMVQRARFAPARDASGRAVSGSFDSRMRWKLPASTPPAPGMLVTTIELSADGAIEKCVAESAGAVPAPAKDAACTSTAARLPSQFFKAHAPAYRVLRFATSISVGDRQFPLGGAGWGNAIVRRVSEVEVGKSGRPIRCTTTISIGGQQADNVCARLAKSMPAPPAGGQEPAAQVHRFENAIYGVPR